MASRRSRAVDPRLVGRPSPRRRPAAAPRRGRLSGPCPHRRLAAGLGRERRGDLAADLRRLRAADAGAHPRRARRGFPPRRAVGAQDPHACARWRRRSRPASISTASRRWTADAAHGALVAIKGIGPWTADIYLMVCLGHADAFAAGDLAMQEAARLALDLPARPTASELARLRRGLAALARRCRPPALGLLPASSNPATARRLRAGRLLAETIDDPARRPPPAAPLGRGPPPRRLSPRLRRRRQRPHRHRPAMAGRCFPTPPSSRRTRPSPAPARPMAGNGSR